MEVVSISNGHETKSTIYVHDHNSIISDLRERLPSGNRLRLGSRRARRSSPAVRPSGTFVTPGGSASSSSSLSSDLHGSRLSR